MSRTKKGSKSPGQEYWGKRPLNLGCTDQDRKNKRIGVQMERAILKRELAKLPQEPDYDEQEYEPHCEDCAKGVCPIFDINGNQVGVNGDWDI
jgi:hypothetical protein